MGKNIFFSVYIYIYMHGMCDWSGFYVCLFDLFVSDKAILYFILKWMFIRIYIGNWIIFFFNSSKYKLSYLICIQKCTFKKKTFFLQRYKTIEREKKEKKIEFVFEWHLIPLQNVFLVNKNLILCCWMYSVHTKPHSFPNFIHSFIHSNKINVICVSVVFSYLCTVSRFDGLFNDELMLTNVWENKWSKWNNVLNF